LYITTKDILDIELSKRKANSEISGNIDRWIEKEYGIESFCQMAKSYFGLNGNRNTIGILARHIPSVKVEDIVSYIGTQKIGLKIITLSFKRDQFSTTNWSKYSCVKMPILRREGKNINKEYKYVAIDHLQELNGIPIEQIKTKDGIPLFEFHANLRRQIFNGRSPTIEFSDFFERCFSIAREHKKVPSDLIAFQNLNGIQKKVKVGEIPVSVPLRPPMTWYYPIFFSLFLNGDFVLLETYSNAPGAIEEFRESIRIAKEISGGFTPLVIETPLNISTENFTSKAMLEYNLKIQDETILTDLVKETENIKEDNISEMFYQIARKTISFRL
jgi:hypothetical protein